MNSGSEGRNHFSSIFINFFKISTSHNSKANGARSVIFGGLVVLLWATKVPSNSSVAQK